MVAVGINSVGAVSSQPQFVFPSGKLAVVESRRGTGAAWWVEPCFSQTNTLMHKHDPHFDAETLQVLRTLSQQGKAVFECKEGLKLCSISILEKNIRPS